MNKFDNDENVIWENLTNRISLKDYFENEPVRFTPFIARNLDKLGEIIGIPQLEKIDTEVPIEPGRADIQARILDDNSIVIIENQFGIADHDHGFRLLQYCNNSKAKIGIWIADTFPPTIKNVLKTINDSNMPFNILAVEPCIESLGESKKCYLHFNVVVDIEEEFKSSLKANDEISENHKSRLEFRDKFWNRYEKYLKDNNCDIINIIGFPPSHGYKNGMKINYNPYIWLASQIKEKQNKLNFEFRAKYDRDNEYFDFLYEDKEHIEKTIGHELEWDGDDDDTVKTSVSLEIGVNDIKNEENWETEIFPKVKEYIDRFYYCFKEELEKFNKK